MTSDYGITMNPKELSKLCENLRLDERDGPVVRIDRGMHTVGQARMDF